MSMQRSTHSPQIYTFGPAMSLRTSFWVLLQNEHLKTFDPPRKICHILGRLRSFTPEASTFRFSKDNPSVRINFRCFHRIRLTTSRNRVAKLLHPNTFFGLKHRRRPWVAYEVHELLYVSSTTTGRLFARCRRTGRVALPASGRRKPPCKFPKESQSHRTKCPADSCCRTGSGPGRRWQQPGGDTGG